VINTFSGVMAGLVPAIHVFLIFDTTKNVDARHKAGHDESVRLTPPALVGCD
jgi:hypothetical protein